jgi:hypothetical protein
MMGINTKMVYSLNDMTEWIEQNDYCRTTGDPIFEKDNGRTF